MYSNPREGLMNRSDSLRSYLVLAVGVAFLISAAATAQTYRNLSSVHDGSGVMSTNTVNNGGVDYRHVSAAGQPGGIFTNANGGLRNYAGFLQAVDIKQPNLDTDGDGVPDEISDDNDGDGLTDTAEVGGGSFDPTTPTEVNVADTDGDTVPDGAEAAAGTDPTDPNAMFEMTAIEQDGDSKVVRWTARDGKEYRVLSADGQHAYPTNLEGTVTASGGSGPWFETPATFTNAGATETKTYGVEVVP